MLLGSTTARRLSFSKIVSSIAFERKSFKPKQIALTLKTVGVITFAKRKFEGTSDFLICSNIITNRKRIAIAPT